MRESGGRRVKRSINIDMNSVRFCTPEMLDKYRKIRLLKDYVEQTEAVIEEYNKKHHIDNSVLVNGRRQTNLGVFRAYLTAYLKKSSRCKQGTDLHGAAVAADRPRYSYGTFIFSVPSRTGFHTRECRQMYLTMCWPSFPNSICRYSSLRPAEISQRVLPAASEEKGA